MKDPIWFQNLIQQITKTTDIYIFYQDNSFTKVCKMGTILSSMTKTASLPLVNSSLLTDQSSGELGSTSTPRPVRRPLFDLILQWFFIIAISTEAPPSEMQMFQYKTKVIWYKNGPILYKSRD